MRTSADILQQRDRDTTDDVLLDGNGTRRYTRCVRRRKEDAERKKVEFAHLPQDYATSDVSNFVYGRVKSLAGSPWHATAPGDDDGDDDHDMERQKRESNRLPFKFARVLNRDDRVHTKENDIVPTWSIVVSWISLSLSIIAIIISRCWPSFCGGFVCSLHHASTPLSCTTLSLWRIRSIPGFGVILFASRIASGTATIAFSATSLHHIGVGAFIATTVFVIGSWCCDYAMAWVVVKKAFAGIACIPHQEKSTSHQILHIESIEGSLRLSWAFVHAVFTFVTVTIATNVEWEVYACISISSSIVMMISLSTSIFWRGCDIQNGPSEKAIEKKTIFTVAVYVFYVICLALAITQLVFGLIIPVVRAIAERSSGGGSSHALEIFAIVRAYVAVCLYAGLTGIQALRPLSSACATTWDFLLTVRREE